MKSTYYSRVYLLASFVLLVAPGLLVHCQQSVVPAVEGEATNGLDGDSQAVVGAYYKPGTTSAQILRARGFQADEFFITTEDNYILSIIRGRNPLFNNRKHPGKEPVLFIHGTTASAAIWVISSKGARPRDFTNIQVNSTSLEHLIELLKDDPSSFSLPILFMNFGHEVWLLNRRGMLESENTVRGEDRTLLDAFKSILPAFLGGGFGPNAGLSSLGLTSTAPANSSSLSDATTLFNLTREQQEEALSGLDDHRLMQLLDGTANNMLNASSLETHPNQPNKPQDKSTTVDEFLRPFINLPGALLDFGKLVKRIIHTFDPKFWSFSLDEQVQFDMSASVDFVLQQSHGKQVALVGHSAGGALILMKLSERPEFAAKVSKAILLSPALNLGHADVDFALMMINQFAQSYLGPLPFSFATQQLQGILQVLCDFKLTQFTLCESVVDLLAGFGGGQSPATPALISGGLQPTASRELMQLGQFAAGKPRKYNFNSPDENLKVYGQLEPPIYDLSCVKLTKMSFYVGKTDTLVSPDDVRLTVSQLAVPYRLNIIDGLTTFFNHVGYYTHKRLNTLVAIPALKDLEHFLQ